MRRRGRPTPLYVSAAVTDDLAQRFISNLSSDWSDAGGPSPAGSAAHSRQGLCMWFVEQFPQR